MDLIEVLEKEEIARLVGLLKIVGPFLRRPHADTLNASAYANMKELRGKTASAVLRVIFAFDPMQRAILLVGGNKAGVTERAFYKRMIARADKLYHDHLLDAAERMKKAKGSRGKERSKDD